MKKKILYLTLKKKWFDMIFVKKTKPVEYRDIKPYWTKRLKNPDGSFIIFDEIHFRNGYRKDSPFGRTGHNKTYVTSQGGWAVFALELGKILEIRR